ncbi:hypothetical protein SAMN05216456_1172 [Devosia crocina]|uniref:Secreted protein n=1 Tax=Devosia crocina TaxID=429728 RepID=A0A1I7N8F0_9HYPH|nr:hypothetical protein [Devosia crocina]SFV30918.1 hypothetical protein SAMN05216456_1172 [Devosia crocina]
MKRLIVLTTLVLGTAGAAFGQEAQCFQNDHYLVIEQPRFEEVGSEFIVRPPARGKIACSFETSDGDIRIGEIDDPIHYLGLAGPYLVLERSTGPDGNLVVYDLDAGAFEPIIDVPVDDEILVDDETIAYWERTDVGTAENCKEYAEHRSYGFGSVISEERTFDIASGTLSASGDWRCSSTQ